MSDKMREALELAREALRECGDALTAANIDGCPNYDDAMDAIDAALAEQPAQGKRAYYETHEPPHCPTCGCGLDAPPAPAVLDGMVDKSWQRFEKALAQPEPVAQGEAVACLTPELAREWLAYEGEDRGPTGFEAAIRAIAESAPPAPAVPDDVAKERDRCIAIVENYQVPIGNSAAGEMARDWTMDALREIRDAMLAAAPEVKS